MDNKKVIYLDDAIEAFKKELTVGESKGNYVTICSAVGYEGAKQILERLPSVQERKKGRWMTDVAFYDEEGCPYIVTRCDQCGEVAEMTAYCPHCGARMEGAEDV